jgi:hypothetical protein
MKSRRNLAVLLLGCGLGMAGAVSSGALFAAENADTNAPIGRYVSVGDLPAKFTLHFNADGSYEVQTTGLRTNRQQGSWKWDGARQEFALTPATNSVAFPYEFRRLRVDAREPETLQWLPLPGIGVGAVSGAVEYKRFRRKVE